MINSLYNILVPVDFTASNEWGIAKAIELANSFQCNIHMVSVTPEENDSRSNAEELAALKAYYQHHMCNNGRIEISLLHGDAYEQLAHYIKEYQMDLVVLGLPKFNLFQRVLSSVTISRLAHHANVPVLGVQAGGLVHHFKKIVVPLNGNVPVSRLSMAVLLGRHFKSTIYLVSLRNHTDARHRSVLDQTLQLIQGLTTVPVQSIIMEGRNLAESTLHFADKINADLIMINPEKDFYMPGFWNRVTRKLLSYTSRRPVLTVE